MKVAVIEPMGIIRDLFVPMSNESIMTYCLILRRF